MHHQHGYSRRFDHRLRHAAEYALTHPRMAVGSHDHEIGRYVERALVEDFVDAPAGNRSAVALMS